MEALYGMPHNNQVSRRSLGPAWASAFDGRPQIPYCPGKVLSGFMKKIDSSIPASVVEDEEGFLQLVEE